MQTLLSQSVDERGTREFQLAGQIQVQYVRCGKQTCHCAGGEPHGPYYYRIWRDGMRIRKVYVKGDELEAVRVACETHARLMRDLREMRAKRRAVAGRLRAEWRATQILITAGKKTHAKE